MNRRYVLVAALAGALALYPACPSAAVDAATHLLAPPVDGVIDRYFEAPTAPYGPGHRGIDYGVPAGTRVRAAAPGTVVWAGSVAGDLSVTIDHGDGLETTYSILSNIEVSRGMAVDQSRFIGSAGSDHAGEAGGLHFGVKLHDEYVDPMNYLGPTDVSGAIHLEPLIEEEENLPHELTLAHEGAGAFARPCRDPAPIPKVPPPPNDNIAVSLAGVGSYTKGGSTNAEIFAPGNGPRSLGYRGRRTYRFSYSGVEGPRLHKTYEAPETWVDIETSARRLHELLIRLRARYPRSDVDLFAHSQGGLVARALLEHLALSFDPRLPRIDHLVTYGTPHGGTPLAGAVTDLRYGTLTGHWAIEKLSEWAHESGTIPDPKSIAVEQMRPESDFLRDLEREDVTYGTRVLALAMPHDAVVPADRALYPGKSGRVLPPESWNGHDSVVSSDRGRAIVYQFLRDAPVSCRGNWDEWGTVLGGVIGWGQSTIADLYSSVETAGLTRAFKVARWAGAKGWQAIKWTGSKAWSAARWTGGKAIDGVKWTGEKFVSGLSSAGRFIKSGVAQLWN